MIAILKKTIGPDFRAGDIIVGENARIKKLNERGLVTLDHSLWSMAGNIISIVSSSIFLVFVIMTMMPKLSKFIPVEFSIFWSLFFIFLSAITIIVNTMYFFKAKLPYFTYYLSFSTNIIGGIFIMAGHETTSHKYQPKTISASAAIILYTMGALNVSIAIVSNINFNLEIFGDSFNLKTIEIWAFYLFILFFGILISLMFDSNFSSRRKRYISFLKRKNATIEYKTKALNAYRTYLETGNSDKFLEKNIELLEQTLDIDRGTLELNEKK